MTALIAIVVALIAVIPLMGVLLANARRDKRREAREAAVAKAACDYLARYKIRGRTIAVTLLNGSVVLMVETPPHKKLRFSYIIEQPIKNFIQVQTGVEVARIFWRFPIRSQQNQVPEVQYADPSTMQLDAGEVPPPAESPAEAPPPLEADEEDDDYFHHQGYRIEEVSWEDFSTLSGGEAEAPEPEKEK